MAGTLKEQYKARQLRRLQERLRPIDRRVITELKWDVRERLILEAFDKQQMAAAIDIVKKLKAINFGALTSLAQARDAAVSDVTAVLGGGGSQGLVRKIVNLFKSNKENPLVDVLAFADALNNFFAQFSQYVTALGGEAGGDQTLGTIVTGKSPDELEDLGAIKALGGEEKKKLAELQRVIVNGLKPEGALANIGKNWIDKYMKGKTGLGALAKDLMKMTVKDLNAISTNVTSGLKNAEAVGQAAAGAAQQGAVGTAGTTGPTAAGAAEPSAGSKGTKSGAKAPGAQVAGGGGEGAARKVYDDIRADFGDMDEKTVMAVLTTLADNDKLKA